jgi:ATP-dependent Lon protease
VKEKVLAAHRAGIGTVILPKLNEEGLADLPEDLRDEIRIELVERVEQVLDIALEPVAQPV